MCPLMYGHGMRKVQWAPKSPIIPVIIKFTNSTILKRYYVLSGW